MTVKVVLLSLSRKAYTILPLLYIIFSSSHFHPCSLVLAFIFFLPEPSSFCFKIIFFLKKRKKNERVICKHCVFHSLSSTWDSDTGSPTAVVFRLCSPWLETWPGFCSFPPQPWLQQLQPCSKRLTLHVSGVLLLSTKHSAPPFQLQFRFLFLIFFHF